MLAPVSLAPR